MPHRGHASLTQAVSNKENVAHKWQRSGYCILHDTAFLWVETSINYYSSVSILMLLCRVTDTEGLFSRLIVHLASPNMWMGVYMLSDGDIRNDSHSS